MEGDPAKVKQFVLDNLGKVPDELREIVESTVLETIISARLRYRKPWELQWGSISKDNVCVVGDALHPMTPDLAQGRSAALEDDIVLVRCLAEALSKKPAGKEMQDS
ncbi:hypothetical protein VitviT2T_003139 [Vitis vinifera]|uniref:FAD-binding domain-containing protein n=1 Tax=Vitis vinifera TaxID=29760 RepID=A0ABY9BL19_VITVI|nr:hypothetical protein VitviT2T_003139 [Vitis vinifera]